MKFSLVLSLDIEADNESQAREIARLAESSARNTVGVVDVHADVLEVRSYDVGGPRQGDLFA
jgi:hypothetical protein